VANDDRADWRQAWALFPGSVAYVWHAVRYASTVQESLAAAEFEVRAQIIWAKDRFALSRGHYHWQHEPCWYAVRQGSANLTGDRPSDGADRCRLCRHGMEVCWRVRPWRHDHHAAGVGSHPCSRRRLHPYLLHCFGDRAISALREQLFLRTRRRSKPDARLRLSSIVHSSCRRRGSVTAVSGCCSCRMSSYCGEIRRYPTPVSVRT
jgi:hypothetical protein